MGGNLGEVLFFEGVGFVLVCVVLQGVADVADVAVATRGLARQYLVQHLDIHPTTHTPHTNTHTQR